MIDNSLDLEQSAQFINAIDFSNTIHKLTTQMGWKKSHALEACEAYRRFLFLQKKYGHKQTLVPSIDIDDFWHMHILDTKNYRRDCEALFGHYCDHDPNIESTTIKGGFAKTVTLYEHEFGEKLYEIRGNYAKIVSFFKQLFKKA